MYDKNYYIRPANAEDLLASGGRKTADSVEQGLDYARSAAEQAAGKEQYQAVDHYIFRALKDTSKENQEKFKTFFNNFTKGDPRLARRRAYPTWRETLAAGFELKNAEPRAPEAGNHETYLVEPKAAKVLRNAWDDRSVYDVAAIGPLFKLAAVGKGLTASIKLAWSLERATTSSYFRDSKPTREPA